MSNDAHSVCGLLVEDADSCTCWINMPTFKSNSLVIRAPLRQDGRHEPVRAPRFPLELIAAHERLVGVVPTALGASWRVSSTCDYRMTQF